MFALAAAPACVSWTPAQSVLATAGAGFTLMDWDQTLTITHRCRELNSIIGHCGERLSPDIFFPVMLAAGGAIAYFLPDRWRTPFLAVIAGMEANQVWFNFEDGYGL